VIQQYSQGLMDQPILALGKPREALNTTCSQENSSILGFVEGDAAMKMTKASGFGSLAIAAVIGLLLIVPAQAEVKSHSGNLIIEQPADLPEMARTPGQALFLHQAGEPETNLYLEQQNSAQLAIFNVRDPAKIKAAAWVPLRAAGVFDFVRYLSGRSELVRFRDSGQLAEFDFREPTKPAQKNSSSLSEAGHSESLAQTGLVVINARYRYVGGTVGHDYRVADVSNPAHPTLLATIKQVKQQDRQ
jgi:hypothetical protein